MPESPIQNEKSFDQSSFTHWLEVISFLLKNKSGRVLTIILMSLIGATIATVAYITRPNQVEITTGFGKVTIRNGKTQNSVFLLSPAGEDENTPWVRTGIQIKKMDRIKITASGRVHTSLKRIVAEAQEPVTITSTDSPWVSPKGLLRSQDLRLQADRNKAKFLPDENGAYYGYGMLLGAVEDNKQQVLKEDIEPIGENHEFSAKNDGELVLTVNDIWLDEKMKNIYVLPFENNLDYYKNEAHFYAILKEESFNNWSKETELRKAKEVYCKRLKSWDAIVSSGNWNVLYEDNVGAFSVSITVN